MASAEQQRPGTASDGLAAGRRLHFGGFELDPARCELWHAGVRVDADPKPLELLVHLVRHRDRVVSRDELRESVWRALAISDAAIASALRDLRRALGDTGNDQRFIRTVRGEGFRFVADVAERRRAAPNDPFVGRGAVLDRLEGALERAAGGDGRWIWLAGDPGMGKSRLLLELRARAAPRGVRVHVGQCLEEGGAAPYRPWQQIARSLLGDTAPAAVEARFGALAVEAQRLLPERARDMAGHPAAPEGEAAHIVLFDGVRELIRRSAQEAPPLFVLLDDLHRADDATVRLLVHVLRELAGLPAVFVAAYRPSDVKDTHPLCAALGASQPGVEHASLGPLHASEVGELVGGILGRDLDPAMIEVLSERTEGNALFATQIARALAEGDESRPVDASEAARILPSGVREAIRSRLETLSAPTLDRLSVAAVLGREFDLDVLSEACAEESLPLDPRGLEGAFEAGVLEPCSLTPGRLCFSHILVRDVLYDRLPELRRARLHASAGRALERRRAASRTEHIAELAHHFGEAAAFGEARRALDAARDAGDDALAQAAHAEAAGFFQLALRALELCDAIVASDATRAALLERLGAARWRAGKPEQARQDFLRAAELARRAGAPDTLAAAALGYAGRTDAEPNANPVAVQLLEGALASNPTRDSKARSQLLARLGTELYYADPGRCDALTRQAVEMAERLGDPDALANALSARGYALMRPDVDPARRIAVSERQLSIAGGSGEVAAIGLQEKLIAHLEQGDRIRLEDTLVAYERLVETLHQPFFRWMASSFRSMRSFLDGLLDEALATAEETFALGQSFGTPNAFPMFSVQLLYIRREQGRMSELEPALRTILDEQSAYPGFRSALPPMYLEMGRPRDARDVVEAMFARKLDDLPRDQHWIPTLAFLAGACADLHDSARARQLFDLLAPFSGRMIVSGHGATCGGSVDHVLARLAATDGDFDLADEHYEQAATLERRAGARLFCAHSQRYWARLLWKRGAPYERRQARDLAAEAASAYETLGLERMVRKAQAAVQD